MEKHNYFGLETLITHVTLGVCPNGRGDCSTDCAGNQRLGCPKVCFSGQHPSRQDLAACPALVLTDLEPMVLATVALHLHENGRLAQNISVRGIY